jgi:hypothetical protein
MRPPALLSRAIGGRGRNYLRILAGRAVNELVLHPNPANFGGCHLFPHPDDECWASISSPEPASTRTAEFLTVASSAS